MAKFKVGDKLRCKIGFDHNDGGYGHRDGETFVVGRITGLADDPIYWPGPNKGQGVYEKAAELASTEMSYLIY